MDIDQPSLRVPAHGSIGTGFDARGILTVSALESKWFSLNVDPWYRMGVFLNSLIELF
jgi:hypothetical protein